MKKAEKILVACMVAGFVMRLFHMQGGVIFQFISAVVLMFFYLLFSVFLLNNIPLAGAFRKSSYAGITGRVIAGGILAGFIFSNIVATVLFRTMAWNGSGVMLLAGLAPLLVLTIAAAVAYASGKTIFNRQLLMRCIAWLLTTLMVWLLPASVYIQQLPAHR